MNVHMDVHKFMEAKANPKLQGPVGPAAGRGETAGRPALTGSVKRCARRLRLTEEQSESHAQPRYEVRPHGARPAGAPARRQVVAGSTGLRPKRPGAGEIVDPRRRAGRSFARSANDDMADC